MKILIAFDKFRGSLTAEQACETAARYFHAHQPHIEVDCCPLSDGGEGFGGILAKALGAERSWHRVSDPLGRQVLAPISLLNWGKIPTQAQSRLGCDELQLSPSDGIAIIEMSTASGLQLLNTEEANPLFTSSVGTGQLITKAQQLGARLIVLGIGGSATNDLGLGALEALGLQMHWSETQPFFARPQVWENLIGFCVPPNLRSTPIRVCCDVDNPLLGPRGATRCFGPQKGLRPEYMDTLETQMSRLAHLLCEASSRPSNLIDFPGAGAAGGIAFGLLCACGAGLVPGSAFIEDCLDLARRCREADLIITGEGCFDDASLNGKGPGSLVRLGLSLGKPVQVFAGMVQLRSGAANFPCTAIRPPQLSLEQAMASAANLLTDALARSEFPTLTRLQTVG